MSPCHVDFIPNKKVHLFRKAKEPALDVDVQDYLSEELYTVCFIFIWQRKVKNSHISCRNEWAISWWICIEWRNVSWFMCVNPFMSILDTANYWSRYCNFQKVLQQIQMYVIWTWFKTLFVVLENRKNEINPIIHQMRISTTNFVFWQEKNCQNIYKCF